MLPVYDAISFVSRVEKGGRTQPWVVLVKEKDDVRPYVVKFFEVEQEEARHSVVNEVIANALAQEFNLPVPQAALIEISEDFKMTLEHRELSFMDAKDERIKFGCRLMEDVNLFNYSLSKYLVQRRVNIETVFAFDVLIRNRDRNSNKPNLLIDDSKAILIDHELGFEKIDKAAIELAKTGNIDPKFTDHHIFLPLLKKAKRPTKAAYFDEFGFYLENLKLGQLNPYFNQLEKCGYNTSRILSGI